VKIGDLVQLCWGEGKRAVGLVLHIQIETPRIHPFAIVRWCSSNQKESRLMKSLELINASR
jgi:hypothetical protein